MIVLTLLSLLSKIKHFYSYSYSWLMLLLISFCKCSISLLNIKAFFKYSFVEQKLDYVSIYLFIVELLMKLVEKLNMENSTIAMISLFVHMEK